MRPAVGLGSPLLPADTPQLAVTPAEVAASYSQLLLRGEDAENFDLFAAEGDSLRTQIGVEAKVIDLRCLTPIDGVTLVESVTRTGHLIVADTAQNKHRLRDLLHRIIQSEIFLNK